MDRCTAARMHAPDVEQRRQEQEQYRLPASTPQSAARAESSEGNQRASRTKEAGSRIVMKRREPVVQPGIGRTMLDSARRIRPVVEIQGVAGQVPIVREPVQRRQGCERYENNQRYHFPIACTQGKPYPNKRNQKPAIVACE